MSEELKAAVERFEALVRALTSDNRRDVAEFRAETKARFEGVEQRLEGVDQRLEGVDQRLEGVDQRLDAVEQRGDELLVLMRQIQSSQVSMSSALAQAVTQLALSRDLDKRVERLEAAVFPSKH